MTFGDFVKPRGWLQLATPLTARHSHECTDIMLLMKGNVFVACYGKCRYSVFNVKTCGVFISPTTCSLFRSSELDKDKTNSGGND